MVAGDSFSSSSASQFSWRYLLVDHLNDSLPNCQNTSGAGILGCFDMVGPDSGPVGGQGGNGWDMAHNSSSAGTFFTQNQTIQAHVSTYQSHVLVVHLGVYDLFFGNKDSHPNIQHGQNVYRQCASRRKCTLLLGNEASDYGHRDGGRGDQSVQQPSQWSFSGEEHFWLPCRCRQFAYEHVQLGSPYYASIRQHSAKCGGRMDFR